MNRIIIGIILITCAACNDGTDLDNPIFIGVDNTFELRSQATAGVISLSQDTVTVEVLEILDSRCPSDVVCIWAGYGYAKLALSLNNDATTVELCIGQCANGPYRTADTVRFELANKEMSAILVGISPFPTTSNGSEEKRALLEFTD
ncbi:hypothetical protein [Fulvivirga sedimenti]|uniref:Uncharacterized protein n=1 Tax=Fulvivirga sedimenti TaxID=2879465 RepID=A0A9X1KYH9_9BACT|nr:hypothetical protein [Fulvivirga sedimenti]MCA6077943.1 hypothetical protein [Fulvivirga sedimenti]